MELKRHLDTRFVFIGLYILAFVTYLVVGLQPAGAQDYNIISDISIPSINLDSDVALLTLNDGKLDTPNTIVGSFSNADNKTLLIGHSSTVFSELHDINIGDEIVYDGDTYVVNDITTLVKADVNMDEVLAPTDEKTIVIMTCAGEIYSNGDASHRLIVTATLN